jgi:nucleoside-diphosphate-sugar epimerase
MSDGAFLITGSEGFLGTRLKEVLSSSGEDYVTLAPENRDFAIDPTKLPKIRHVFHLAARTFVPASWESPVNFYETNTLGTVKVLEFCRSKGCSLTFPSTYVYGNPNYLPIDEGHPVNPNSPYNHSKLLSENLCQFYAEKFNVSVSVLRLFNVYGPGQKRPFLIPEIIHQALENDTIELMDLSPRRDFVHVNDVIDAMLATIDGFGFEVYNVGSGVSTSVEELVSAILGALRMEKIISATGAVRPNEVMDTRAEISKISKMLGWRPKTSLVSGIQSVVDYQLRLKTVEKSISS